MRGTIPAGPIPVKLRVLMGLTDVLKGIGGPTEGYAYDIKDQVYRGILSYGDERKGQTFLSILEPPAPPDQQPMPGPGGTALTGWWDIVVQGFCPEDRENPSDPAQYLLADVKRAIGLHRRANQRGNRPYLGMPNTVLDIQVGAGTVRPPDDLSISAYCYLLVRLQIAEDTADPYAT